ncbi:MAG: nitroreductase [Parcubacteria group bacterium CG11_big_fil_rev_8_21_14_0_20_39_14]|nr:MAG: nitroreductase [Parcubacteria group bacterium CG11_big_fil_rev_8_21_14_0_20_39_14]PIS35029.1 MAG: nitroreductase [Parcubacteria group bacterium CG08_land_8_20_14_0_20_38_56]
MSILETIRNRRSIREFQARPIPEEAIANLIDALIWAPSAGNLQSRKFYFVFNKKIKEELARAANEQNFVAQAPLIVVGCSDDRIEQRYYERGKKLYSICDVAMSIQNLMLLASDLNLGTVPVGAFDEARVSKILNVPKNLHPILIVPVGYPAEKPEAPSRVSPAEALEIIL